MKINYRVAAISDIELLLRLMREFNEIDNYGFAESTARPALEKFIGDSSLGYLWLIEGEDKAIGYAVLTFGYSFEFHGRDAFVDELFLEANYRGQGIGNRTMQFIEDRCREFGVKALHLEVERTNIAGLALYRKFGFKDHDRYLMTKWLSK